MYIMPFLFLVAATPFFNKIQILKKSVHAFLFVSQ